MRSLSQFEEIWVVDFEYRCPDGCLPMVHCMVAREVRSQKVFRISADELSDLRSAPFDTHAKSLFVAYYSAAEFGCYLELGWEFPVNTLDLYVEFRLLMCGAGPEKKFGLVAALNYFNLGQHVPSEKQEWRELAMRGGPFTETEWEGLLDYCQQDVDATAHLLLGISNYLSIPHALIRGRYMQSVARMERNGIPMDTGLLSEVRELGTYQERPDREDGQTRRIHRRFIFRKTFRAISDRFKHCMATPSIGATGTHR